MVHLCGVSWPTSIPCFSCTIQSYYAQSNSIQVIVKKIENDFLSSSNFYSLRDNYFLIEMWLTTGKPGRLLDEIKKPIKLLFLFMFINSNKFVYQTLINLSRFVQFNTQRFDINVFEVCLATLFFAFDRVLRAFL